MPQLLDPNFQQTVTYVCKHDENGALGIIVNRPLNLNFAELLEHLEISSEKLSELAKMPVFAGGPGQLEHEIAENAWLCGPADTDILFTLSADKRWHAAAAALGVNLHLLSTEAGHA